MRFVQFAILFSYDSQRMRQNVVVVIVVVGCLFVAVVDDDDVALAVPVLG